MKKTLKELYGVGILFFYFFKWPFFLGFIYMYSNGLDKNYILIALWFYSLLLILKDFYKLVQKRRDKR